jgi:hypothetical protein
VTSEETSMEKRGDEHNFKEGLNGSVGVEASAPKCNSQPQCSLVAHSAPLRL